MTTCIAPATFDHENHGDFSKLQISSALPPPAALRSGDDRVKKAAWSKRATRINKASEAAEKKAAAAARPQKVCDSHPHQLQSYQQRDFLIAGHSMTFLS